MDTGTMKVNTQEELVSLLKELKELGVHRLKLGDVEVEMLPGGATGPLGVEDDTEPEELEEDTLFYSSE